MKKAVLKLRKNSGAHIAAAVLGGVAVFLLLLNIVSVDGTTQSIFLVGFRRFLYFMENGWVFAAFAEIASWVLRLLFLISLIAAPILAKKSFLVSVVPCGILVVCCIWRILFGSLWSEEAGAFLLLFFIDVALGLPLLLMGLGAVKTKTAAIVVSSVLLGFFTLLTLGEGLPFVLYLDNGRYEIVNLSGFFAFQLECIAILVLAAGTESPAEYAARLQAETVGNGFAPMGNRGQFFAATNIKGNPYAEYGRNPYSAAYAPPARPTAPSSASAPASVRPTYASSKASNVSAPARPMPAPISPNASAPVRPMPAPISPNASMPAKPMGGVSAGAPVAVEDKTEAIVKRMKLLERLKSEGLIGDEEYRAKREEILKNI